MADSELPIDSQAPNYSMSVVLAGVAYWFDVRWNQRAWDVDKQEGTGWFFDLLDSERNPIVTGVRMSLGTLLGRKCTDPRFPNGAFFVSDLSGEHKEAGYDDLGRRVKMYFRPAADIV